MAKGQFLPGPGSEEIETVDFDTFDSADKTDADDKTDALVNAMRADKEAFVNILKQPFGGNSSMQFVERIPADKYDFGQLMSYIANTYGGGEYRLMIYANGKLKGNKLQSIAQKVSTDLMRQSPTGEAAGILATVLDRMEANNRQMMEMISKQNQAPDRMAMLQEMIMFKELFAPAQNQQLNMINPLTQLKESMELLQGLGVSIGGEKESGFTDLLAQMAPVILNMTNQPAPSPVQVTPQQNPIKDAPKPAPQQTEKKPQMNFQLKAGIAMLINAASKDSNQMTYAEMIMDNIDENLIREYITDKDSFLKLQKIAPQVVKFKPWFELLAEHVKAQLGIESTVSDLYADESDAINGELDDTPG